MKKLLAICVLLIPGLHATASEPTEEWFNLMDSAQVWSDSGAIISVACWHGQMGVKFIPVKDDLFDFKSSLGADSPVTMFVYRIDGGEENSSIAVLQERTAYIPISAPDIFHPFLRNLKTGSSISISFITSDKRNVRQLFTLKGSTAAIKNIENECG